MIPDRPSHRLALYCIPFISLSFRFRPFAGSLISCWCGRNSLSMQRGDTTTGRKSNKPTRNLMIDFGQSSPTFHKIRQIQPSSSGRFTLLRFPQEEPVSAQTGFPLSLLIYNNGIWEKFPPRFRHAASHPLSCENNNRIFPKRPEITFTFKHQNTSKHYMLFYVKYICKTKYILYFHKINVHLQARSYEKSVIY